MNGKVLKPLANWEPYNKNLKLKHESVSLFTPPMFREVVSKVASSGF